MYIIRLIKTNRTLLDEKEENQARQIVTISREGEEILPMMNVFCYCIPYFPVLIVMICPDQTSHLRRFFMYDTLPC